VTDGWITDPLAFPRASHPAITHSARQGGDGPLEHGSEISVYGISRTSNLADLLDACDLASHSWMRQRRKGSPEPGSGVGDETITTPFGDVALEHGFPTDASSELLFDQMDAQRAAQAYFWSMPLVGFACWRDQQAEVYDARRFGDFVVFDSLEAKRGLVTGNLTTPYIINWTDLSEGPVLIDYPPGQTAGRCWTSGSVRSLTSDSPARTRGGAASTW
jgi:hypothetical protein